MQSAGRTPSGRSGSLNPAGILPTGVAERERSRAEMRAEQRGYQLAQLRKNAGLTQAQVAAVMGVTQARVSQIEHGKITEVDAVAGTLRPSAAPSMSSLASVTGRSRSPEHVAANSFASSSSDGGSSWTTSGPGPGAQSPVNGVSLPLAHVSSSRGSGVRMVLPGSCPAAAWSWTAGRSVSGLLRAGGHQVEHFVIADLDGKRWQSPNTQTRPVLVSFRSALLPPWCQGARVTGLPAPGLQPRGLAMKIWQRRVGRAACVLLAHC